MAPTLFLLSELWDFRKGTEEPEYHYLPSLMNWVEDTWNPSVIMGPHAENHGDFWQHNSVHWKKDPEQILVNHNWGFLLLVLKPEQIWKHLLGIWGNWGVGDGEKARDPCWGFRTQEIHDGGLLASLDPVENPRLNFKTHFSLSYSNWHEWKSYKKLIFPGQIKVPFMPWCGIDLCGLIVSVYLVGETKMCVLSRCLWRVY